MDNKKSADIFICSLKREESLAKLLESLDKQTRKDFNIYISREEGELVDLKDKQWRDTDGEILIWLDDDIICWEDWFENLMKWFEKEHIIGITGPTLVPQHMLKNRDVFKSGIIGWLYNKYFLEDLGYYPGTITPCGASTFGANFPTTILDYPHIVDFLEPSQFAIRRWAIEKVNGFDRGYHGVAEWSDVDLCYRIRNLGTLLFCPNVKIVHYPEKDKAVYEKRLDTRTRYENYCRFSDKFVRKSFKHYQYRLFLKTYFFLKERRFI